MSLCLTKDEVMFGNFEKDTKLGELIAILAALHVGEKRENNSLSINLLISSTWIRSIDCIISD